MHAVNINYRKGRYIHMQTYSQLIRQAQRGDADAVTEIVDRFDGLIVSMALCFKAFFPDFEEAKSISTCALIDGIYSCDLMTDTLVAYHFKAQIVRRFNKEKRLLIKHDKHRQHYFYETAQEEERELLEVPDTAQRSPEETCILAEERVLLAEGMALLSQCERDVLHLKYYAKKTNIQIGEALGIHRHKVGMIHKDAREQLRQYLQNKSPKRFS